MSDPIAYYLAQDALVKLKNLESVLDDLFPKSEYDQTGHKKLIYSLRSGVTERLKGET